MSADMETCFVAKTSKRKKEELDKLADGATITNTSGITFQVVRFPKEQLDAARARASKAEEEGSEEEKKGKEEKKKVNWHVPPAAAAAAPAAATAEAAAEAEPRRTPAGAEKTKKKKKKAAATSQQDEAETETVYRPRTWTMASAAESKFFIGYTNKAGASAFLQKSADARSRARTDAGLDSDTPVLVVRLLSLQQGERLERLGLSKVEGSLVENLYQLSSAPTTMLLVSPIGERKDDKDTIRKDSQFAFSAMHRAVPVFLQQAKQTTTTTPAIIVHCQGGSNRSPRASLLLGLTLQNGTEVDKAFQDYKARFGEHDPWFDMWCDVVPAAVASANSFKLADTRSRLAKLETSFASTRTELAGTRTELAGTRTELAGTRTELAELLKALSEKDPAVRQERIEALNEPAAKRPRAGQDEPPPAPQP